MNEPTVLPLSNELLHLMHNAARHAVRLRDGVITPRAMLLAFLDDPHAGAVLSDTVDRAKLEALEANATPFADLHPVDEALPVGETPAITAYDTIAFKTPDGSASVWLGREAFAIFLEGMDLAREDAYLPRHLAFGLAAQALHAPALLAALRLDPGVLADAMYKL